MMDLDELKAINDRLGHFHGDRVLRGVGEVITQGVRQIDTAARYGGDEFVVLLPETDPTGAFVLAEKIRLGVEDMPTRAARRRATAVAVDRRRQLPGRRPQRGRADDQRRRRDVRLEAGRQGPRDGRAGTSGGPPRDSGVASLRERHRRRGHRPDARGFSTRAIRAASRDPGRRPDADERPDLPDRDVRLGRRRGARPGRRGRRAPASPTAASRTRPRARSAAPTPSSRAARPGAALASGMAAIHAALASLVRAGDRIVAPIASYGSTRSQLDRVFGGFGVRVDFVDTTDLDAVAAALAAAPTRVLYAETIANPTTAWPTTPRSPSSPIATARRTSSTTRSPRRTSAARSSFGADLVVESATKFLGGHSDVIAGVVAGSSERIAGVERVADRHRGDARPARGVPRPARDPDPRPPGRAPRRDGRGTGRLARASATACARVLYPGLASHPQHDVALRQFRPGVAGGMLAFEVAGGRDGRPGRHRRPHAARADRLARQRPHDGRPPAVDLASPARRGRAAGRRDHARAAPRVGRARGSRGPRRTTLDAAARRHAGGGPSRRARRRLGARAIASTGGRLGDRPDRPVGTSAARLGYGIWRLFTSVNFAVLQIIVLALLAVVGMTHPAAAGLRLPLGDRLRGRDGATSTPATTRLLGAGRGRRARAAPGLPHLPLAVVQRRARRPRRLDRRLHARPDAPPVAPVSATSGSPSPSRSSTRRCPTGRRWTASRRRRSGAVLRRNAVPRPRGGRRRTARASSTAIATSTRRWRRCSPTSG